MNLMQMRAELARLKAAGSTKVAEYNALAAQIGQMEAAARTEAETRLAALAGEIDGLKTNHDALAANIATEERRAATFATFAAPAAPAATAPAAPRNAADLDPARTGGFASVAEFATSVRAMIGGGGLDHRLAAAGTFMQNGGNAGEGFMVPPEFRDQIWNIVHADDGLLSEVDSEPTNSNSVMKVKDESTPWGASGVQAAWRAEGQQMNPSKIATEGALVQLHEVYAFVAATDELMTDAPRLSARLSTSAGQAITWKTEEAFTWGNGVGKPLGFLKAPALVTVDKEAGQAADTIVAQNVAKMLSRLLGAGPSAHWRVNSDVIPQLLDMRIGDRPIWTPPSGDFTEAPGGYLLGRPIKLTEHAAPLGDLGDISLIDPKGYYSPVKSGGVQFASSMHLWFDQGLQAFRWTFRVGGQPHLSKPVQPARGTNTKSHFVALAARN